VLTFRHLYSTPTLVQILILGEEKVMRSNRRWFVAGPILLILPLIFAVYATGDGDREAQLSGPISTITIYTDTRLVDNVTCTKTNVSCIVFGAPRIKLSLDGHTITGPVDPLHQSATASCDTVAEFLAGVIGIGIDATGQDNIDIEGPGVIQHFQNWGVFLGNQSFASNGVAPYVRNLAVRKVTATLNCWSGMQTLGVTDSHFENNVWANNAVGSNGAACGGICLSSSNNNVIHTSTFYGNGSLDYANGNVDFGIGFEGSSSENRIEENDIGGNTNGVSFFNTSSDNVVRRNIIVGNPAAQLIKTFTATNQHGADIAFRPNFTGANNRITDNFCLTYIQGSGPATAPCPNIRREGDERKEDDEARNR
jgi:parallel beta-helix repeat protein